jgi:Holliday junction resolvase
VHRYIKGARSERELINTLYEKSYSVMRSAGSGVNSLSPDIIAFKDGVGFAFECKAWNKGRLAIEPEKFEDLKKWEQNTKMNTMIAWRMNGKGWFFIKLDEMKKSEKSYSVTRKVAMQINRRMDCMPGLENK